MNNKKSLYYHYVNKDIGVATTNSLHMFNFSKCISKICSSYNHVVYQCTKQ